ncbi:MAG TPA: MotA/TolQ/ExbB proton channel family protein [Polyangia bacterium]|jgi:biopolymer transport protein ExbB|nr:MotA/TolQ/ExbB proton channel family protein [Polyangia bacterium]
MRITERLLSFTLLGSEWVLWLLIGLSVLSVTVMVERGISLRAAAPDFEALSRKLLALLGKGDYAAAKEALGAPRSPEVRVALVGLAELPRGRDATAEAMASAKARERLALERNLGVLGTLGNNAPFIGLFGTVLGIIRAFADLAKNQTGGAGPVMTGISEALVATAVGLMVAIPAVIAYNTFQGRLRRMMGRVDAMAHLILSAAPESAEGERAARG